MYLIPTVGSCDISYACHTPLCLSSLRKCKRDKRTSEFEHREEILNRVTEYFQFAFLIHRISEHTAFICI